MSFRSSLLPEGSSTVRSRSTGEPIRAPNASSQSTSPRRARTAYQCRSSPSVNWPLTSQGTAISWAWSGAWLSAAALTGTSVTPISTGAWLPGWWYAKPSTVNLGGAEPQRDALVSGPSRGRDLDFHAIERRGRSCSLRRGERFLPNSFTLVRLAPRHHARNGELHARFRVDVEPIEVGGTAQVTEVEHLHEVSPVGGHQEIDERIDARIAPVHGQPLAVGVVHFQHGPQLGVDPLGPALQHDALTGLGLELETVDVARLLDPPVDHDVQRNVLGAIERVVRLILHSDCSASPAACAAPPTAPRCFAAFGTRLGSGLRSTFSRCTRSRSTMRMMTPSTDPNWCVPCDRPLTGAMA